MIKNVEEQKAKLKERIGKEIDEYFENLENSTNQENFDINKMEQLMLENQGKLERTLRESNSELGSNVEADVKKTAQSAEAL